MKQTKNIIILLIVACMFYTGCTGNGGTTDSTQKTTSTIADSANSTNQYEMGLVRSLPTEADAGTTFTVKLTLSFNGTNKPGLLGVTENYPSNWSVSNISGGGVLKQKSSSIEWLFFPPFGPPVQNTTISYQLTTPNGIEGSYFFDGDSILGSGAQTTITGEDNITIKIK
jgi:predicted small secreted protein